MVGNKKIIAITLRESTYETARNSNLNEWSKFIQALDKNIYFPVILRDLEKDMLEISPILGDVTVFHAPVWNIEIRAAFYEKSYLNMMVNNGPAIVAYANEKTRLLLFKMVTEKYGATNELFFKSIGMPIGTQPKFFTRYQKIVWKDDDYEVLQQEFNEMCNLIESNKI